MTDIATRIEPMPTVSDEEACWDVAIHRLRAHNYGGGYTTALVRFAVGRDEFGTAKYKTRLRPNDGRSSRRRRSARGARQTRLPRQGGDGGYQRRRAHR